MCLVSSSTHLARSATARPSSSMSPRGAARLQSAGNPEVCSFLWNCLDEAMVAKCTPGTREPEDVQDAVSGGAPMPEVLSEDEYKFDRVRRSEILDLDHLCTPRLH